MSEETMNAERIAQGEKPFCLGCGCLLKTWAPGEEQFCGTIVQCKPMYDLREAKKALESCSKINERYRRELHARGLAQEKVAAEREELRSVLREIDDTLGHYISGICPLCKAEIFRSTLPDAKRDEHASGCRLAKALE